MVAITSPLQPAVSNRRRRVRHKIQTPAYATFNAESQGVMLDLHEIVNISEDGVAIQCHSPLEVSQNVGLCLDLAGCSEPIFTSSQVIWINDSGRAGLRFLSFPPDALSRLREWLFVNVISGVANSEPDLSTPEHRLPPTPNYTDRLAAISTVRRQVENLGPDFESALHLIAERAQVMVRASGAAIALAESDPDFMICRASSGPDAPPVGARLQVGSGFSGECIQKGTLLRCDDTEVDPRVDRASCRALGIRSILAAPIRAGEKSIGLVESFSPQPFAFSDADERVLQKLAETILDSATRAENLRLAAEAELFSSRPGSVLFASADGDSKEPEKSEESGRPSISLPQSHLILLMIAAAAISLTLGWLTAPWIQSTAVPWIGHKVRARRHDHLPTVLASSKAPAPASPTIQTATFDQLRLLADKGDAEAENALGLRYAIGDGVKLDEKEAVRWFTKAAEQGSVSAQSKLGAFYYGGRGVKQDSTRAYFWMVVASLNGDEASKTLAPHARAGLTRSQMASIEQEASRWLQQHSANLKPTAGQPKS